MLLSATNLWKQFSGTTILKNINFTIDKKDKKGLIGLNGAGKTTLIKILIGLETHDESLGTKTQGEIAKKFNLKIGYLSQSFNLNMDNSVFDELMSVYSQLRVIYQKIQTFNNQLSENPNNFIEIMEELAILNHKYEEKEGYAVEYKVKQVLNGLNFPHDLWENKISDLSGGQQSRIALGKILLDEPDLLILDEPTNHLELYSIEWLEKYLKSYKKAFILISHDRYFLDNVITKVFELESKTIKIYRGNFSEYIIQKEVYLVGAVKSYKKEQEKRKKTEEYILKYMGGIKTKQALGKTFAKVSNKLYNFRHLNK